MIRPVFLPQLKHHQSSWNSFAQVGSDLLPAILWGHAEVDALLRSLRSGQVAPLAVGIARPSFCRICCNGFVVRPPFLFEDYSVNVVDSRFRRHSGGNSSGIWKRRGRMVQQLMKS